LGTPGIFDAVECEGSSIRECSMEDAYTENFKVDAYRPKLDGIFFRKKGPFFEGPWFIPAPDTKIEEIELLGMDCFVLQPLGYRGGRSLSGHVTSSHGFTSSPEPSEEGIILLRDGVEFRIKRRPTTEVNVLGGCYEGRPVLGLNEFSEGVAEVCLSGTSLVFIRWRFGRKANNAPFEYFMRTPWLAQFDLKKTERSVVYRYDTHVPKNQFVIRLLEDEVSAPKKKGLSRFINLGGLYKDTVTLLSSTVILDCPRTGRQVLEGLDTLLSSDDFFRLETGEPLTISFKNRTVMSRTVKLAFRSPLGVPFVMQGNKKLSLIGGRVKAEESLLQAIQREALEEVGWHIPDKELIHEVDITSYGHIISVFHYIGKCRPSDRIIWLSDTDLLDPMVGWFYPEIIDMTPIQGTWQGHSFYEWVRIFGFEPPKQYRVRKVVVPVPFSTTTTFPRNDITPGIPLGKLTNTAPTIVKGECPIEKMTESRTVDTHKKTRKSTNNVTNWKKVRKKKERIV
jgi:8-oxo-dGTP pyrophosphatase MutT (NUDIX family)